VSAHAAALSPSAQRVQQALVAAGLACVVVEHAVTARTSAEAAAALGCSVAEIAKSLVFRHGDDGAVLVIASGANRVDERKVAAWLGAPIRKADAAFVREHTGYAIGGIPPLAHAHPAVTLVDADLLAFAVVHAAGGTPNATFAIRPADLVAVCGGRVADVRQEPAG
jgi:prolyl-tRNA editing enzyme YbaK/EbsC (Cys-tRNA(Pro) deacylase)